MCIRINGTHPPAQSSHRRFCALAGRGPSALVGAFAAAGAWLAMVAATAPAWAAEHTGAEKAEAGAADADTQEATLASSATADSSGAQVNTDDAGARSETNAGATAVAAEAGDEQAAAVEDPAAPATDALPGSHRPVGLGLSPEAPPAPPAPGGRALSFGAPTPESEWTFGLTGRFSAWESVGLAERPDPAPEGYHGGAFHVPALVAGKQPFWAGAGMTLNMSYGNPRVSANVTLYASMNGIERRGYNDSSLGPDIGVAYLSYTPAPLGPLQLRAKVGAFRENFGGPGQWGWGIFGPLIGIKGYGESVSATYPLSAKTQLDLAQGLTFVPAFPEEFVRGSATGWAENARTTWVHHGHAGLSYQNQYVLKLHYASAQGTDERTYLADDANTTNVIETARDGHMNVYVVEARATADPYGQLGISGGYWDMKDAVAVHDGIWWGIDWTGGGREMGNKFLGELSHGNGKLGAISAEYGFSIARILWYPRSFDGRAPDIRIKVAGVVHHTFETQDEPYEGTTGYLVGSEVEYQMIKWMSATLRGYGENRHSTLGRFADYSLTPSLVFRKDWQSPDRIELAYTRMFYSSAVNTNTVAPLDRNILTLGVTMSF
jgi:hypothetical protein